MDCVNICPSKNTLTFKPWNSQNTIAPSQVGIGIVLTFIMAVYFSGFAGTWKSMLPENEFRMWLKTTDLSMIQHPAIE